VTFFFRVLDMQLVWEMSGGFPIFVMSMEVTNNLKKMCTACRILYSISYLMIKMMPLRTIPPLNILDTTSSNAGIVLHLDAELNHMDL